MQWKPLAFLVLMVLPGLAPLLIELTDKCAEHFYHLHAFVASPCGADQFVPWRLQARDDGDQDAWLEHLLAEPVPAVLAGVLRGLGS